MRRFVFKDQDGDLCFAKTKKEDSALEYIYKRIKEAAPIETVKLDSAKKAVLSFNVSFERALTPKEASDLVTALKVHIIKELDKAEKFYVSKNDKEKGGNNKNAN